MSTNRIGHTQVWPSIPLTDVEICKVAKADVQQLKSVRDDLANRFKENDKLHNDVAKLSTSVAANTRKRLKRKLDKLTSQITAINRIIKHLETHTK